MIARIINKFFVELDNLKSKAYLKTCLKKGLILADNVVIRNGVSFGSEPFLVEINENSRIASGVIFVTHSGATQNIRNIEGYEKVRNFGRIKIGKNCAIGSNSVILQNVEIGNNCILGANSVLSVSMPDNTVYLGNPAQYICEVEDYADVLLKTSVDYPIELEKNRKKLDHWLIENLPKEYKSAQ